ncbi:Endonuclease V [Bienertia sinuspersici]
MDSTDFIHHFLLIQDELKKRLVTEDDFPWELPSSPSSSSSFVSLGERKEVLKYVGGVDISFLKEDPSVACGTLVVLEIDSLNVVYDDFCVVRLQVPYIPGFLAFRELLMVDGNGLLHPRGSLLALGHQSDCGNMVMMCEGKDICSKMFCPPGFGLACHLGVMADLPTIGIGKNVSCGRLHHVEGLNHSEVRDLLEADDHKQSVYLNGNSGRTLGVAIRSTSGALKPIFISIGNRISLNSAMKIVKMTCKYRVPEPIRQNDRAEAVSA